MAKRSRPVIEVNWYLREWMDTLQMRQRDIIEKTDWSKTTASLLYNRQQDYTPKLLNEAAAALNREPYELLLPPARAMQIRRMQRELALIAADTTISYTPEPPLEAFR